MRSKTGDLCDCGTKMVVVDGYIQRHFAPCGAICLHGCMNGDKATTEKINRRELQLHEAPWEGPEDTDGHYHGKCPNNCFVSCCNPPGNLCGKDCQRCFPQRNLH